MISPAQSLPTERLTRQEVSLVLLSLPDKFLNRVIGKTFLSVHKILDEEGFAHLDEVIHSLYPEGVRDENEKRDILRKLQTQIFNRPYRDAQGNIILGLNSVDERGKPIDEKKVFFTRGVDKYANIPVDEYFKTKVGIALQELSIITSGILTFSDLFLYVPPDLDHTRKYIGLLVESILREKGIKYTYIDISTLPREGISDEERDRILFERMKGTVRPKEGVSIIILDHAEEICREGSAIFSLKHYRDTAESLLYL